MFSCVTFVFLIDWENKNAEYGGGGFNYLNGSCKCFFLSQNLTPMTSERPPRSFYLGIKDEMRRLENWFRLLTTIQLFNY